ncbi:ATP-binding protein [Streptomyces sp. NPDC060002]|uniref:ATP-binding protein n=1 Tax=Streptomyces sp. NPDC060002 TaxID=3347033 RepID=UPI0036B5A2A2
MPSDAVTPIALLTASLRLTAVPSAVATSRMFVRHTLARWRFEEHTDTATLVMSELVTNAVKASGITDPHPKPWQIKAEHVIGIQLRAIDASLYVEVWDRISTAPLRQNPTLEDTSGRGLLLLDELVKRWNVYHPHVGGKVVWAELPLGVPLEPPPFDQEYVPLMLPPGIRASRGPVEEQARTALFDQLLKTTVDAMISTRVNDAT